MEGARSPGVPSPVRATLIEGSSSRDLSLSLSLLQELPVQQEDNKKPQLLPVTQPPVQLGSRPGPQQALGGGTGCLSLATA